MIFEHRREVAKRPSTRSHTAGNLKLDKSVKVFIIRNIYFNGRTFTSKRVVTPGFEPPLMVEVQRRETLRTECPALQPMHELVWIRREVNMNAPDRWLDRASPSTTARSNF